jgi:hypothetical protein
MSIKKDSDYPRCETCTRLISDGTTAVCVQNPTPQPVPDPADHTCSYHPGWTAYHHAKGRESEKVRLEAMDAKRSFKTDREP